MRQGPREEHKPRFAMADFHQVHFGHGKFACPAKALALTDIKMTATALLPILDRRFSQGHTTPRNISIHETVFPKSGAVVEFRRRGG